MNAGSFFNFSASASSSGVYAPIHHSLFMPLVCQKPTSSHECTVAIGSLAMLTKIASGKILVKYSSLAGPVNFMINLFFPWYFTCFARCAQIFFRSFGVAFSPNKKLLEKSIRGPVICSQKAYRSIGLKIKRLKYERHFCRVFLLTPTKL